MPEIGTDTLVARQCPNDAPHGDRPMLACAFLPFLPLIVDAQIRQLGDDDFSKRESATRFLSRVLADTDGFWNYSILLAVKKARENKSAEIKKRAKKLYDGAYRNYFREYREYPFVCIAIRVNPPSWQNRTPPEKIEEILGDMLKHSHRQSASEDCDYYTFRSESFTRSNFVRIKSYKNDIVEIIPTFHSRLSNKK
jgi:hypothetical protein